MLVSIVVPTYNRPELLGNALKSISIQTYRNIEVVVVNDGGADVRHIIDQHRRFKLPIQYIVRSTNRGLANARNTGIDHCKGNVICFLDDDDVLHANHIAAGVRALASDDVDAAYTSVQVCNAFVTAGCKPHPSWIKAHYRVVFDERLLRICNFIPVHAVFLRRRGYPIGFDEKLTRLEDWDLWLRLHDHAGYRFRAVAETTAVYHRVPDHPSMTGKSKSLLTEAADFLEAFRAVVRRYPTTDRLVHQGRELHEYFYDVVRHVCQRGQVAFPFSYERLIHTLEAFVAGVLDASLVRALINSFVAAPSE